MGNIHVCLNSQVSLVTRTFILPHKLVDSEAYQELAECLFVKNTTLKQKEGRFPGL